MDSILNSIKKVIGFEPEYDAYDIDIIMHINTIFSVLNQIGVGPEKPLRIEDATTTWDAFTTDRVDIEDVKTYVYIRVRLLFDPPTSSFVINALTDQYKELEWRLNISEKKEVADNESE